MSRKITSHWQPLFSKKMAAAAASFSYKIGGGGLIFLQNWRRRPHFPTKLAAAGWRQGFGNITGDCSDMVWILVLFYLFCFLLCQKISKKNQLTVVYFDDR